MLVSTKRGLFVTLDLTEDQVSSSVANIAHYLAIFIVF